MIATLSPSMVAALIAEAADQQGVTPSWLASQADVIQQLGLDPALVTQGTVTRANRLFRQAIDLVTGPYVKQPTQVQPAAELAEPPAVDTGSTDGSGGRKAFRGPKLFGKYSLTAVVRRLAVEGWDKEDIWFFLGQQEVGGQGMSEATVRTQMQWGKKGHQPPAPLDSKELAWCQKLLK